MAVIEVTKDTFEAEVINSDKKVVVDFWASWCGPCKMLSPVVDEVSNEMTDVKFCKINVDEQGELASKYSIMSIPTLMVFDKGQVVNQAVGAMNKDALKKVIQK